jgi:hypothetical protein
MELLRKLVKSVHVHVPSEDVAHNLHERGTNHTNLATLGKVFVLAEDFILEAVLAAKFEQKRDPVTQVEIERVDFTWHVLRQVVLLKLENLTMKLEHIRIRPWKAVHVRHSTALHITNLSVQSAPLALILVIVWVMDTSQLNLSGFPAKRGVTVCAIHLITAFCFKYETGTFGTLLGIRLDLRH